MPSALTSARTCPGSGSRAPKSGSAAVPSLASADLSIRTVSGQRVRDVAEQIRHWFETAKTDACDYTLTVDTDSAQEPCRTPEHPVLDASSRSMAKGFGAGRAGRMGNAGGSPAELLSVTLGLLVTFFGTGFVEDNWHDSDESAHIDTLEAGSATLAFLWDELGLLKK